MHIHTHTQVHTQKIKLRQNIVIQQISLANPDPTTNLLALHITTLCFLTYFIEQYVLRVLFSYSIIAILYPSFYIHYLFICQSFQTDLKKDWRELENQHIYF